MKDGRVEEKDLIVPILRYLSGCKDGFAQTSELIRHLEGLFKPVGQDAEILNNRRDTYFSQKVRNVVSHRPAPNSPVSKGWIVHVPEREGLKITDAGINVLNSMP